MTVVLNLVKSPYEGMATRLFPVSQSSAYAVASAPTTV